MHRRPSPLLGAAHIAALWALAFAQPLFELLGRNSVFFVARGSGALEILAFALAVTVGPFLVAWALETGLERISPAARWAVHLGLVGLVSACLFLQLVGQAAQSPAGVVVALALALGAGLAWLYAQGRFMRLVLDVLSPAPAVVLVLFLLVGPTSKLVLPEPEPEPVGVEVPRPAPVVMVIFDELPTGTLMRPDGSIDRTRFPAFAELASRATWYRDATTAGAFTSNGVPAILTGRRPEPETIPIASELPESVFTLLGDRYRMAVLEDATRLCPEGVCPEQGVERSIAGGLGPLLADLSIVSGHLLLPEALRGGLPEVTESFGGFADDVDDATLTGEAAGGEGHVVAMALARESQEPEAERVAAFGERLEAAGRDGAPAFNLIHIKKPHYPWRNLPDGRNFSPTKGEWIRFMDDDSVWRAPRQVVDIALQRHMLETGHADTLLGEVIGAMKRAGIWDEALLVVTSDHGGAMIPGEPRRNPTASNIGQIAPVPLFLKAPGQRRGRLVGGHACTTDVLPLMASTLGIRYPWEREGCPAETVTVDDLPDGSVEAPFAEVMAGRSAYVRRIGRLFGTGNGWGGVYAPRAWRSLVGRPVGSHGSAATAASARAGGPVAAIAASGFASGSGTASASGSPLELAPERPGRSAVPEEPGEAEDHDPADPLVPALLQRGELEGVEPGSLIAIEVNGRIAAAGPAFDLEGTTTYSILLPPRALRPGENEIAVHLVLERGLERGETVELKPVRLELSHGSAGSYDGSSRIPAPDAIRLQPLWP